MASRNKFEIKGLRELLQGLRNLPIDLTADAARIVYAHADRAKKEITDAYPVGPTQTIRGRKRPGGNLKKGMETISTPAGPYGVAVYVRNRAPHAYIFEHGTQARQTDLGYDRGPMPPGNVFIPIVIKTRRQMYDDLAEMLVAHGLKVSGSFDAAA